MVADRDRLPRLLGTLLLAGSWAGVLLSFVSLLALQWLGEGGGAWPLSVRGWWTGEWAILKFTAGLGIIILGATPVAMLLVFLVRSVQERRCRTVGVAVGLLVILALGLLMDLLEQIF